MLSHMKDLKREDLKLMLVIKFVEKLYFRGI